MNADSKQVISKHGAAPATRSMNARNVKHNLCGLCALKKYHPVAGNTDDGDQTDFHGCL